MKALYVTDYVTEARSDSEAVAACLADFKAEKSKPCIIFSGRDWEIDEAILLSDGMTVIIDGCTVRQTDDMFDNVFRGDNITVDPEHEYGTPLEATPIRDIKILGKNGAKIIGPNKNRIGWHPVLMEQQEMVGDFWGWRTLQICLSRCDNFEIGGLTMEKTRSWAMSFELSSNGYIHDIHFDSRVKNGDGIDFRAGCHDCRVEHITGYTSDDTVACTALWDPDTKYPHKNYLYPLQPALMLYRGDLRALDIRNIEISGIYTGGRHHGIICLAACGLRVYDINISEVRESNEGAREATVKIYTGYGDGYTAGDIHHIRVTGVTSQIADFTVMCNAKVRDVFLSDITHEKSKDMQVNLVSTDGITIV